MQCPVDHNELKLIEKDCAIGHRCIECKGVFLSKKSINAFKYNYQSDVMNQLIAVDSVPEEQKRCPACHCQMSIKSIENIELDCSNQCGGIWFDQNELDKIISNYGNQPRSGTSLFAEAFAALFPFS